MAMLRSNNQGRDEVGWAHPKRQDARHMHHVPDCQKCDKHSHIIDIQPQMLPISADLKLPLRACTETKGDMDVDISTVSVRYPAMASNRSSGGSDAFGRLKTDADVLREEAHAANAGVNSQQSSRMDGLLAEHLLRPTSVNIVEVHGAKNTRRNFLEPILLPLRRDEVRTLGEVINELGEATTKLSRFDIFRPESMTVQLDDARNSDPLAAATDLNIAIKVAETSRFKLQTGTDFGDAEGNAYGNLLWRNVFGGAESLTLNASAGTRTRSAYSAAFATPLRSNSDLRLSVEGLASATQKPWASHEEVLKGGSLRLAWLSKSGNTHSFAYSGAWRQLTGLAGAASPTVRADAGDSFKSSIAHTFTHDRRNNPMLPQQGYLVRTVSELAGWGPMGGDVSFAKSEAELSGALAVPLPGLEAEKTGVSVGAGLRVGALYPLPFGYGLGGPAQPSRVNDRFQLGGPTDVRGFKLGGIGPHDGADAVGGDVFAAGSVNVLLPLPRAGPTSPLRLQLFANGGRLVALKGREKGKGGRQDEGMSAGAVRSGMASALGELANGLPSTAVGFGLVYAHPAARFELNFCLPLVMRRGEEARKGLQVGVGINFM